MHKENGYPDIEGNQGFKDQQMALRWVQDNIEGFGGDKTRVDLLIESYCRRNTRDCRETTHLGLYRDGKTLCKIFEFR